MTAFIVAALILVVVAMSALLLPLRRQATARNATRRQLNAAIYRDQLAELENDRREGAIAEADYELSKRELQRRMLEDATDEVATNTAVVRPQTTPWVLGLAVPLAAVALYLLLGTPAGVNPPPPEPRFSAEDIERMVAGLAARLEKEPDNLKGWTMLARSYKALGRFDAAVRAFERAGKMVEADPNLLADYADVLAARQQGFDAKSMAVLDRALKLDPDNLQALWLRGTAAVEAGAHQRALADWERLLKLLPAESEDAATLRDGIAAVREKIQRARGAK